MKMYGSVVLLLIASILSSLDCAPMSSSSGAKTGLQLRNLQPAYLHTLGKEAFPVEFSTDRKVSTFHVYHIGLRLADAKIVKNNMKFQFTMDPSNKMNAGEYEVVFDEGLTSEFRQKTSLYLLLNDHHPHIHILGVRESNVDHVAAYVDCEVIGVLGPPTVLLKNGNQTIIGSASSPSATVQAMNSMTYTISVADKHLLNNIYCIIDAKVAQNNGKNPLKSKPFYLQLSEDPKWSTESIAFSIVLGIACVCLIVGYIVFRKCYAPTQNESTSNINTPRSESVIIEDDGTTSAPNVPVVFVAAVQNQEMTAPVSSTDQRTETGSSIQMMESTVAAGASTEAEPIDETEPLVSVHNEVKPRCYASFSTHTRDNEEPISPLPVNGTVLQGLADSDTTDIAKETNGALPLSVDDSTTHSSGSAQLQTLVQVDGINSSSSDSVSCQNKDTCLLSNFTSKGDNETQ